VLAQAKGTHQSITHVRFYLTVCAMYSNVDGMQFKQIKSELQIT
jgi:hypothetical protein